jgi:hypothetical protein
VWVRLNDENSEFFLTGRRVGQGDPASHIIFNFMPDVLTRILIRVVANN